MLANEYREMCFLTCVWLPRESTTSSIIIVCACVCVCVCAGLTSFTKHTYHTECEQNKYTQYAVCVDNALGHSYTSKPYDLSNDMSYAALYQHSAISQREMTTEGTIADLVVAV